MPSLAGSESSLVISAGWSGDESLSFAFPLLQDQPDAMQVGRQHRQGNRTQRDIEDPCTPAFALDPAARRMPMRGVRCGSHACGHQSRNSWRMAAARVWSHPIPYAIGARIASDYAGRPVLPPSQTVCGFAQGQGRVRQWPRRRPLPAVLEPVGSQRDDRQQFQLATGNVEVGGQDFGRSTAGRRHRSGRIGRGCSSMALECTSAAGGQRGKPQPHHRSWMSTASNGGPVTMSPSARAPRAADPAPPRRTA